MSLKFILYFVLFKVISAELNCTYLLTDGLGYTCSLKINNPNGLNNFTVINGTHLAGYSDENVSYISNDLESISPNVPSIICNKFPNVHTILLRSSQIIKINDYSFRNCSNLVTLTFSNNSLTEIDENALIGNLKLEALHIEVNPISKFPPNLFRSQKLLTRLQLDSTNFQEFPNGIFSPLVNMTLFSLNRNKLLNISSIPFGSLPNLRIARFQNNQIKGIDEKFIDNTGVTSIDLRGNECINREINDTTATRSEMKQLLRTCFVNYSNSTNRKYLKSFFFAFLRVCKLFLQFRNNYYNFADNNLWTDNESNNCPYNYNNAKEGSSIEH